MVKTQTVRSWRFRSPSRRWLSRRRQQPSAEEWHSPCPRLPCQKPRATPTRFKMCCEHITLSEWQMMYQ